ncbi:hypothetical protein [Sphingobacterium sp. 1.A.5]|uniref:hypothetical protein n=1 Tax=Sphingobacterium sp. 1.A.5 TaxID=2044604 RepID=UPI000C0BBB7A|nr:hypothetical protein [Sphingobacterium sp. 1.A.5]
MNKILLIVILVGILIYFLSRRVMMKGKSMSIQKSNKQGYYLIESGASIIQKTIKNTLFSVGIGVVLFIITIFLALKVKIILLMLPISLYLMSQLFLLNNQLKYAKDQHIWFNPNTNVVMIEWLSGNTVTFNILIDVQQVKAVKSVQKNNQILFGYYEISVHNNQIYVPFILEDNPLNTRFFKTLKENYPVDPKSSLFPII